MIKKEYCLLIVFVFLTIFSINAQLLSPKESFTKADTLRGSNNENRDWWDVLHYSVAVTPDFKYKTISGSCSINFKVLKEGKIMQIDLQDSLVIDRIYFYYVINSFTDTVSLPFKRKDGVYLVDVPELKLNSEPTLTIKYHGKPKEAVNPPWDGGWVWTKDSLGNPWVSVACQEDRKSTRLNSSH